MTLWTRFAGLLWSLLPHAASLALLVGGVEAGIIITRQGPAGLPIPLLDNVRGELHVCDSLFPRKRAPGPPA